MKNLLIFILLFTLSPVVNAKQKSVELGAEIAAEKESKQIEKYYKKFISQTEKQRLEEIKITHYLLNNFFEKCTQYIKKKNGKSYLFPACINAENLHHKYKIYGDWVMKNYKQLEIKYPKIMIKIPGYLTLN